MHCDELGGAMAAHLDEWEERLDGCKGSEDVDIEDALELGQLSAGSEHG